MSQEIIVIIGGPGTGKTTIIDGLLAKGYCCYPEISREVTLQAKKEGVDQLFLENPLLFSELLLNGRKNQYINARNEPHNVVFLDRGLPDVLAYMHYIGDSYPTTFDAVCKENKYTKIFILPPWENIYIADNERYENYGYNLVEVPKDTVENRINFILSCI